MSTSQQLQQAYQLIKDGRRREATQILVPIVRAEPNNPDAWWLMANAVSNPDQQRRALEQVLRLRPNDEKAQRKLAQINASSPPPESVAPTVMISTSAVRQQMDDSFADLDTTNDPFADVDTYTPGTAPQRPSAPRQQAPPPPPPPQQPYGQQPYGQQPMPPIAQQPMGYGQQPYGGAPMMAPPPPQRRGGINCGCWCLVILLLLSVVCCIGPVIGVIVGGPAVYAGVDSALSQQGYTGLSNFIQVLQGSATADPNTFFGQQLATAGMSSLNDFNRTLGAVLTADPTLGALGSQVQQMVAANVIGAPMPTNLNNRGPIEFGETVRGNVPANSGDAWVFTGTAGTAIVISMQQDRASGLDTFISLYGPNNTLVAFDDDGGDGFNSLLNYDLTQSGTYTIVATSFGGGSGAYVLSLSQE